MNGWDALVLINGMVMVFIVWRANNEARKRERSAERADLLIVQDSLSRIEERLESRGGRR